MAKIVSKYPKIVRELPPKIKEIKKLNEVPKVEDIPSSPLEEEASDNSQTISVPISSGVKRINLTLEREAENTPQGAPVIIGNVSRPRTTEDPTIGGTRAGYETGRGYSERADSPEKRYEVNPGLRGTQTEQPAEAALRRAGGTDFRMNTHPESPTQTMDPSARDMQGVEQRRYDYQQNSDSQRERRRRM